MIHHSTGVIAKAFNERGEKFNIEQRGPYSCVNIYLIPEIHIPGNMLRFISSENDINLYLFDTNQTVSKADKARLLLVCNELNSSFPYLKFFVLDDVFVAIFKIPGFIPKKSVGQFCFDLLNEIKESFRIVPYTIVK